MAIIDTGDFRDGNPSAHYPEDEDMQASRSHDRNVGTQPVGASYRTVRVLRAPFYFCKCANANFTATPRGVSDIITTQLGQAFQTAVVSFTDSSNPANNVGPYTATHSQDTSDLTTNWPDGGDGGQTSGDDSCYDSFLAFGGNLTPAFLTSYSDSGATWTNTTLHATYTYTIAYSNAIDVNSLITSVLNAANGTTVQSDLTANPFPSAGHDWHYHDEGDPPEDGSLYAPGAFTSPSNWSGMDAQAASGRLSTAITVSQALYKGYYHFETVVLMSDGSEVYLSGTAGGLGDGTTPIAIPIPDGSPFPSGLYQQWGTSYATEGFNQYYLYPVTKKNYFVPD